MKRLLRALPIVALAAAPLAAMACGACIEDKVAAAYDHAVVARAGAQGRVVVFADPQSPMDAKRVAKAVAASASRTPGIDPSSIRTAQSPASLSFALDPRAGTPEQALERVRRGAKLPGLQLSLLRVLPPARDK